MVTIRNSWFMYKDSELSIGRCRVLHVAEPTELVRDWTHPWIGSDQISDVVAKRGGAGQGGLPPPKLQSVGISCRKIFDQKYKIWGLRYPILKEFMDKIEILCTHNVLCRKFAAVCRKKTATFCPAYFLRATAVPAGTAVARNSYGDSVCLSVCLTPPGEPSSGETETPGLHHMIAQSL